MCESASWYQISLLNQKKKDTRNALTQPRVIRPLSSVNRMTSSSSSIVHVSLVECCFGIRSVETTYLFPLSFPNNSPHVSIFRSVFALAIVRNRGRHSRGRLTVRRAGPSVREFEEEARVIRSGGKPEAGMMGVGTGGAGREGPG